MNAITIVGGVMGVVAALGLITAYFRRSAGTETIKLLQANVAAYKDSEVLKDQTIAYLKGQILSKDNTIQALTEKALKNDGK